MARLSKGRKRVLKVCPNCGSTAVRPVKAVDEWASVEEQMESGSSDKYECDECGYKGELIAVQEVPDEEHGEKEAVEPEEKDEPFSSAKIHPEARKVKPKIKKSKSKPKKRG